MRGRHEKNAETNAASGVRRRGAKGETDHVVTEGMHHGMETRENFKSRARTLMIHASISSEQWYRLYRRAFANL